MSKAIYVSLLFIFCASLHIVYASPPNDTRQNFTVIINQVRGEECCSIGSLTNTKSQLENTIRLNLPTTFVLRYDALTDKRYTDLITSYRSIRPDLIHVGVMIEIVPSLIESAKSQVPSAKWIIEKMTLEYKGSEATWFQAQNAFTIGYPVESRKAIIDTIMKRFRLGFGSNPLVTSAWMIDTDSLNYLHDTYGVQTHQITREQWSTDSYTLYGGPPHYPYPASRNWLFMPDYSQKSPVTIVRQTVADPLYNYGDNSSSFTSQPNDYARAGRTISYFKKLVDNAFSQNNTGFVNVGLENSMPQEYQSAFDTQVRYIAGLQQEGKTKVIFPEEVGGIYNNLEVSTYSGVDDMRQALWITTPAYRVRVIKNNASVYITDIRLYAPDISDPYNTRVAKHEGYWIAPFLIDGSRWHEYQDVTTLPHKFVPIRNDFWTQPTGYLISQNATDLQISQSDTKHVSLTQMDGTAIAQFDVDSFQIPKDATYQSFVPTQFPVSYSIENGLRWNASNPLWSMQRGVCQTLCAYTLAMKKDAFSQAVERQYPYVYPEAVDRKMSLTYSKVSVTNTYAIAGRNPIRLMIEPHDQMNFPILLHNEAQILTNPEKGTKIVRLGELVKSQLQYVDLYREIPSMVTIRIQMNQGGTVYDTTKTVFFAPNCKTNLSYCATHPIQGVWYFITKISDWWKGRK